MQKREKTINGRDYQILIPPVRQAMPLCARVATMLGPAIGALGGQADDIGWGKFATALQSVDPIKVDAILTDATKIALLCFENKRISDDKEFNSHFDQFRSDVYPVCVWALWECVRDFFPELTAFIQIFPKPEKVASVSRSRKVGQ